MRKHPINLVAVYLLVLVECLSAISACKKSSSTADDAKEGEVEGMAGVPLTPEQEQAAAQAQAAMLDGAEFFAAAFAFGLDDVRWGEFHGHTDYSSDANICGAQSLDAAYKYAKGTSKLDFIGLSDHAEFVNAAAEPQAHKDQGLTMWQSYLVTSAANNDEDFADGQGLIVFPSWEYTNTHGIDGLHSPTGYGHKNVVFKAIEATSLPSTRFGADPDMSAAGYAVAADAPALWAALSAHRASAGKQQTALTIVHTPSKISTGGSQDHRHDWNVTDGDFVRNVEVESLWGTSEGPAPSAANCAQTDAPYQWTETDAAATPLSVRTVLHDRWVSQKNPAYALSFVGGSDNHFGKPGDPAKATSKLCGSPYRASMTGVVSAERSRDGIWAGLLAKRTLATSTLKRTAALLGVTTSGKNLFMGEVGSHDGNVKVHVLADAATRIEVMVDGCLQTAVDGAQADLALTLSPGHHYLYARVISSSGSEESRTYLSPVYLQEP